MAPASMFDAAGSFLLHVGPHVTESAASATSFDWRYAAASVVFVGAVGGLLYWYFGS